MSTTTKKHINSNGKVKALVSTEETQGQRSNDFCFVPEGELVKFGVICDGDKNNPDGGCGCARSLCGFYCHKATTTFRVAVVDMTREKYIDEYVKTDPYFNDSKEFGEEVVDSLKEDAEFILDLAAEHPENSVFEFRADHFVLRKPA
jgi:hypothetical protein